MGTTMQPSATGSTKPSGDTAKRFLVANFLRECGLFWNRQVDNPEFLEAWFEQLRPYTASAIEKAMADYLKEEERFPVPGALIPRIREKTNCFEVKGE